jgi:hypothetical protein
MYQKGQKSTFEKNRTEKDLMAGRKFVVKNALRVLALFFQENFF